MVWRPVGVQLLLDEVGDRRLAGARQAGEPERSPASGPSAARARLPVTSSACQWMLVAAAQPEVDHAGADRRVGEAVDQDEGAGLAVLLVGVEGDRRAAMARLQKPISFSASVVGGGMRRGC